MDVDQIFAALDYAGVFLFALSGGILAARKALDPFGASVLGAAAGMGGGTLRDLFLGDLPVYWVDAPEYLAVAVIGGIAGYYGSELVRGETGARRRALVWADAAGLSVFCVIGAEAGLAAGAHWSIAVLTGVMSAAFGGLIRDIIVNEVPLVLRADVYALVALAGSAGFVAAVSLGVPDTIAAPAAALITFALRGGVIVFNLSLPGLARID